MSYFAEIFDSEISLLLLYLLADLGVIFLLNLVELL